MNNELPNTATDQLWIWGCIAGALTVAALVKYSPRFEKWLKKWADEARKVKLDETEKFYNE